MNPVVYLVIASVSRKIEHHFRPIAKAGLLQFNVNLHKMRSGSCGALGETD
jgi:hypothetical protein